MVSTETIRQLTSFPRIVAVLRLFEGQLFTTVRGTGSVEGELLVVYHDDGNIVMRVPLRFITRWDVATDELESVPRFWIGR